MIELKMTGMCEGCLYFEPEMQTFFTAAYPIEQVLTCKHSRICRRLENYFREHPPEGGETDDR
ncbi:MAG: hypothetical protein IJI06_09795 [Oscillospiraceae bacterium]|nr:hypothetical protein [Oscillospiraceae bacterium]